METAKHPYPASPTKVIHVSGTDHQIGKQHAEQVGEAVSVGMLGFYYDFWKRMLNAGPKQGWAKPLYEVIKRVADPILVRQLASRVPPFAMERLEAIAEVSEQPIERLLTAIVLPDLLPILSAYSAKFRPHSAVAACPPPVGLMGCSSFVSSGKNFFYGRNLDFPGVAYWDRYPVIQATHRTDRLRYIGFTTAGVPICGITGINEAQITVSLHQHYCKETSLKGSLPFIISEEILGRARSLEEALDILRSSRVASSWAFIVTDGKRREAFVYECHPKAAGIRWLSQDEKVLAHSNFFNTPECQPSEYALTARMNWDNHSRKNRLEQTVKAAGFGLSSAQAVKLVSEHFDPYWGEEKIVNRVVSQCDNIQSVVMDPEHMKAYLAEGDAPIHIRNYREFDLGSIFDGKDGSTGVVLEGFRFSDPKKERAKEAYVLSYIAAFDGLEELAAERLRQSMSHNYSAEGGLVSGVLSMKRGDYVEAITLLEQAKEFLESKVRAKKMESFSPEYFEVSLFLARAYDLLGKRSKSVSLYRAIASHPDLEDTHIRRLAVAEGPYRPAQLERIFTPYSSYIPFE
ncbi:MAG: hypothetical protein HY537_03875 [Deltaproteobacteria bacterium]|nr:hypothetical protein [Deltaproteobacteria bacterium]